MTGISYWCYQSGGSCTPCANAMLATLTQTSASPLTYSASATLMRISLSDISGATACKNTAGNYQLRDLFDNPPNAQSTITVGGGGTAFTEGGTLSWGASGGPYIFLTTFNPDNCPFSNTTTGSALGCMSYTAGVTSSNTVTAVPTASSSSTTESSSLAGTTPVTTGAAAQQSSSALTASVMTWVIPMSLAIPAGVMLIVFAVMKRRRAGMQTTQLTAKKRRDTVSGRSRPPSSSEKKDAASGSWSSNQIAKKLRALSAGNGSDNDDSNTYNKTPKAVTVKPHIGEFTEKQTAPSAVVEKRVAAGASRNMTSGDAGRRRVHGDGDVENPVTLNFANPFGVDDGVDSFNANQIGIGLK